MSEESSHQLEKTANSENFNNTSPTFSGHTTKAKIVTSLRPKHVDAILTKFSEHFVANNGAIPPEILQSITDFRNKTKQNNIGPSSTAATNSEKRKMA